MQILLIDNYDSFTYNLKEYLQNASPKVRVIVKKNDEITLKEIQEMKVDGIVLSPGPGSPTTPKDVGIGKELIEHYEKNVTSEKKIPILGVCLGHQLLGLVFGAKIIKTKPMHGEKSVIRTKKDELFADLDTEIEVMRYHSLIIDEKSLPACLKVTAQTKNGIIMAIKHKDLPLFGVQFHPESIGTQNGQTILKNFIKICEKARE